MVQTAETATQQIIGLFHYLLSSVELKQIQLKWRGHAPWPTLAL